MAGRWSPGLSVYRDSDRLGLILERLSTMPEIEEGLAGTRPLRHLQHRPPIATLLDHHLAREEFVLVTAPDAQTNLRKSASLA